MSYLYPPDKATGIYETEGTHVGLSASKLQLVNLIIRSPTHSLCNIASLKIPKASTVAEATLTLTLY